MLGTLIIILEFGLAEECIQYIVSGFPVVRGHRGFINNILIGVWCSVILTLVIEIVNYFDSKKKAINKFIYEAILIYNQYEILKMQLSNNNEDIDKVRGVYQVINQMNVSGLYDSFNELTSLIGDKEIAKLVNRIFYTIETFRQAVKRETEALWIWIDEDMVRGKINELNKKFEYTKPSKNGWGQCCNIANDIQEYLDQLNNLYWKNEWYRQKIYNPYFLRWYTVEIIKWNKNTDKNSYNYRLSSDFAKYRKIPFMNYRVKINKPIQGTQEQIEKWNTGRGGNEK